MRYTRRVEALITFITSTLDETVAGEVLADRVHTSRYHLGRLFRRATGETPGRFRRRLLLERAAYRLAVSDASVTDTAFDAGFETLEAFTRAFRKAYGASPSLFRRLGLSAYRLSAPSGVHFMPEGDVSVDLLDHLLEHDVWLTRRMLERARSLTDEQLDRPLGEHNPLPFEAPQRSLREMFHRQVFWKEVWLAAITGHALPEDADKTVEGMLKRLDKAFPKFSGIAKEVREANRWQDTFVDALCTPAETFSYGGVLTHVVTFSAHQRQVLLTALRRFGIDDLGSGDPLEYRGAFGPARDRAPEDHATA